MEPTRGKIALVTGATMGIGRAVASALGLAGYAIGVTARSREAIDALVAELTERGIRAAGLSADVGEPDQVTRMVAHLSERLGPIDTLINNAGVLIPRPFLEQTVEEWDETFRTNVRGVFLCTQAVVPGMIARGQGDIVNVASLAGKNVVPGAAGYSASKHAVVGLSRSLMLELRPFGIRVMVVCPGSVDTPMMRGQSALTPKLEKILRPPDVAAAILAALAMPRWANLSELDLRPANP